MQYGEIIITLRKLYWFVVDEREASTITCTSLPQHALLFSYLPHLPVWQTSAAIQLIDFQVIFATTREAGMIAPFRQPLSSLRCCLLRNVKILNKPTARAGIASLCEKEEDPYPSRIMEYS